ncbi:hypothetical protein CDL15_Pgr029125 [Punica granatum]|uniref:Uncharacterized protein n=1 Tax=Punica granatum TaxID=22663 RepID=A0A218XN27_PUNGR|nr:hypothetical protein CDL15_Pgr029125 [Punica granatum]
MVFCAPRRLLGKLLWLGSLLILSFGKGEPKWGADSHKNLDRRFCDDEGIVAKGIVTEGLQIENTCRGQVEQLEKKVELGSKVSSDQLRPQEHYGLAKFVVSCDVKVENMTYRKVNFGECTIVKLKKPNTSDESKGGLDLSERTR